MLVTIDRYRAITGDHTTPAVDVVDALADAVDRLEERLERKLESAERTERMHPTRDWSVWPHAIPITAAPAAYVVDGHRLRGSDAIGFPFDPTNWPINGVDLTYTGGWVERTANPDATNRLPIFIEADLAWAAYQIARPARAAAALDIPEGATSLTSATPASATARRAQSPRRRPRPASSGRRARWATSGCASAVTCAGTEHDDRRHPPPDAGRRPLRNARHSDHDRHWRACAHLGTVWR
jgi:hypothetical protein